MLFPKSAALVALLITCCANSSTAQTPLTTELVTNGFTKPVEAISPPGDSRIFVTEQNSGKVRIFDGTSILSTPFINIKSKILSSGNEEGLLGFAFHPNFNVSGAVGEGDFFVNYSASSPRRSVVARYSVSTGNPNIADPASEQIILSVSQPFSNHNGGCLRFGQDGYLYIGFGDGGSANDPFCNAQNPTTMLGKMLRIDIDGGTPYAIPAGNPFVGNPNKLDEIWSIGLRNPWRYSFDALTGELYIGDVGQGQREEVDIAGPGIAKLNFGWKMMEGLNCFQTSGCPGSVTPCNDPSLTLPVAQYNHGGFGGGCSITGGEVYRGCKIPDLFGTYFYADYCSNIITSFDFAGGTVNNQTVRTGELAPGGGLSINSITSFGVDGDGEMLIVDQGGEIYRIIAAVAPSIVDCDSNGKDDVCEITMNPSLDGNGNGVLDVCEPTCGFSTYGVGASPTNYIALSGAGSTSVGGTAQVISTGALGSVAYNMVTLAQATLPALGGIILVDNSVVIIAALTGVSGGTSAWSVPIPMNPALAGLNVFFQSGSPDPAQPAGWGLSNGLKLVICP